LPDEKAELKQSYNTIKKYWGVNGAQSKSLVNKREGLQVRILLLKRRPSNLLVLEREWFPLNLFIISTEEILENIQC
jgi:hypothetical protein